MASKSVNKVYLGNSYSVATKKELNGIVSSYDQVFNDYYFNKKTFEQAEIYMQSLVLDSLITDKTALIIAGDLSSQIAHTNYNMKNYNIPFLGVYNACASFVESLIIMSSFIMSNVVKEGIVFTSSHSLNSEKQFKYPVEYGAPKKLVSTITATGASGCNITKEINKIKVESFTIGRVVDSTISDVNNMGAVMAPSCASTIYTHLKEMKRDIDYYDLVLTGDLGSVGCAILSKLLKSEYNIMLKKHIDAGNVLYKKDDDFPYAGASGPACLPLVLFNSVLKNKKYKKILIVGTGSLHNPTLVNQHLTIPSIAHAVSLEVL